MDGGLPSRSSESTVKIKVSYWSHLRRLVNEFIVADGGATPSVDRLLEAAIGASRSTQQHACSELFMMLGRQPNAPELAALLGRRIPLTAYGELSLGIKVAPTMRDALRLAADFHHDAVPLVECAFEDSPSEGRFVIGFRTPIDSRGEATLVMSAVCTIDSECARYTGRTGNIKGLKLTPSSRGFEPTYRKELSISPDTDHSRNVIVFNRFMLDHPNPLADPDTYAEVRKAYAARNDLREIHVSPMTTVRERIMASIGKPPELASVAAPLQMTPRQLRLALAKDGTNYQTIVRECRIEYASALFKNPALSLSQIAERLGYSDPSAFTHAFCRWTGKSPSLFRIEMLSQSSSL